MAGLRQGTSHMHLLPFESSSLQLYSPQHQNASLRFHLHESLDVLARWFFLPVHLLEARRLSKQVPILFYKDHQDQISMAALLVNQYGHVVKGPRKCALDYLPVTFRLYPFTWVDRDKASHIAIYKDAPHFQGKGEKLFTSKNKPTQRMRTIIHHVGLARTEFQKTQTLFKELEGKVNFKPFVINKVEAGQKQAIAFLQVDFDNSDLSGISPELNRLIRAHVNSLNLIQVKETSVVETTSSTSHSTPEQLIVKVCDEFGVSKEELISRKRSDAITHARKELAQRASQQEGMLELLAERLERTVATLKRWSA